MITKRPQSGFTIVELMVATTVFSIVMLISLAAVMQIGKMYYKGVVTSQNQEVARAISNNISQSIQLSSGGVTLPVGANGSFCVGNTRYTYSLDKEIEVDQAHVLWTDTLTDCASVIPSAVPLDITQANPGGIDGRELIGQNMRLSKLSIATLTPTLYDITVGVIYGDTASLVAPAHTACSGSYLSTQFCAVTNVSTTIKKRL